MLFDLHTHTNASDGTLTAAELLARAGAAQVDILAITDHDTVTGSVDAANPGAKVPTLIHGIELSTCWNGIGIHVLGLNIDPGSDAISDIVISQQRARISRAELIAQRLQKAGLNCALGEVKKLTTGAYIGRPHFAQHLVDTGAVKNVQQAFKKFLGPGKVGDVKNSWASMQKVITTVLAAGGTPVLAHPAKYKLTSTKLKLLVDDFSAAGGRGLEVVSGKQSRDITQTLGALCEQKNMLASCGSDFHQPGYAWSELGQFPPLPARLTPVWDAW